MNDAEVLILRAKHFKQSDYYACNDCPISRTAKEHFNTDRAMEGVEDLDIITSDGIVVYKHEIYLEEDFLDDKRKAIFWNFDNTIIREIKLIKAL